MQGGASDPRTQPLQLQQAGSGGHPGAHLLRCGEQAKQAHHLQAGAGATVAASILQSGRLHPKSGAVCRQASAPPPTCPEMTCLQLRGMIAFGWLATPKVCCASGVSRILLHLASARTGRMHCSYIASLNRLRWQVRCQTKLKHHPLLASSALQGGHPSGCCVAHRSGVDAAAGPSGPTPLCRSAAHQACRCHHMLDPHFLPVPRLPTFLLPDWCRASVACPPWDSTELPVSNPSRLPSYIPQWPWGN